MNKTRVRPDENEQFEYLMKTRLAWSHDHFPDAKHLDDTERDIMPIRSEILSLFTQVAREQDKKMTTISDDLELLESGLDSLCFAIIVARLEDTLGIDPFSTAEEEAYPVTVGDFIRLYENAAA